MEEKLWRAFQKMISLDRAYSLLLGEGVSVADG